MKQTKNQTLNKKQEQRQASLEALQSAALSLFVSQGYHATNLEQIAKSVNLTKGAVYFYFKSKEALLLKLLNEVETIVVTKAIDTIEQSFSRPIDRLIGYVHYQANLGITHRDEVLLLILTSLEFKERPGLVNQLIAKLNKRQITWLEAVIKAGQKSGDFRTDIPVKELASFILATNDGTFLEWFRRSKVLKGVELVKVLRRMILDGIRS